MNYISIDAIDASKPKEKKYWKLCGINTLHMRFVHVSKQKPIIWWLVYINLLQIFKQKCVSQTSLIFPKITLYIVNPKHTIFMGKFSDEDQKLETIHKILLGIGELNWCRWIES